MSNYRHFTLAPVADGVWAALSAVNAGIVDLGDQTLVFDTFATTGPARELRAAAEALTGRPPTFVINSHVHPDHVQGNVVFAGDATLVASATTRNALAAEGVAALERMKASISAQADNVRQQLAAAADENERARLQATAREYAAFFADYPTPDDLRLPTLTYERQLTFHGSRRTAHLMTFGGAHSPCDAVLWLPAEQLLFVGDLVIPGDNQILVLGHPDHWLPIITQLEALGARTLVPGHGDVVPAAEGYAWVREYLTQLFRRADEAVAAGETPDAADRMAPPAGCSAYWFRRNMRYLIERRMAAR